MGKLGPLGTGEMLEMVLNCRVLTVAGSGDTNLSQTFFWGGRGDRNTHRRLSRLVTR